MAFSQDLWEALPLSLPQLMKAEKTSTFVQVFSTSFCTSLHSLIVHRLCRSCPNSTRCWEDPANFHAHTTATVDKFVVKILEILCLYTQSLSNMSSSQVGIWTRRIKNFLELKHSLSAKLRAKTVQSLLSAVITARFCTSKLTSDTLTLLKSPFERDANFQIQILQLMTSLLTPNCRNLNLNVGEDFVGLKDVLQIDCWKELLVLLEELHFNVNPGVRTCIPNCSLQIKGRHRDALVGFVAAARPYFSPVAEVQAYLLQMAVPSLLQAKSFSVGQPLDSTSMHFMSRV